MKKLLGKVVTFIGALSLVMGHVPFAYALETQGTNATDEVTTESLLPADPLSESVLMEEEQTKESRAVVHIPDNELRSALNTIYFKQAADAAITDVQMKSLKAINISNRGISDLTGLETAVSATRIAIVNGSVLSMDPLKNLLQLTELDLSNNALTDITAISKLRSRCRDTLYYEV